MPYKAQSSAASLLESRLDEPVDKHTHQEPSGELNADEYEDDKKN